MSMLMMMTEAVPSMMFVVAASCALLAFGEKSICPKTGSMEDECRRIADVAVPLAMSLASGALLLGVLAAMGVISQGRLGGGMMGMGGGYGMGGGGYMW